MQRYPGDRKYKDPDVPQQEQRTEQQRQRKHSDRKWDNPDVPKMMKKMRINPHLFLYFLQKNLEVSYFCIIFVSVKSIYYGIT